MSTKLVVKNARVFDGTGSGPVDAVTVFVRDGRIIEIGPDVDARFAEGEDVEVVDATGMTVIPGLMDLHVHHASYHLPLPTFPPEMTESLEHSVVRATVNARQLLEAGFTTVRDTGGRSNFFSVAVRDGVASGLIPGPRIKASGHLITTTAGHVDWIPPWASMQATEGVVVDGVLEIVKEVRRQVKCGVDNLKIDASGGAISQRCPAEMITASPEELQALVTEAHVKGKTAAIHAESSQAIINAARVRPDTIEHAYGLNDESLEALLEFGVPITTTWACDILNFEGGREAGFPESGMREFEKRRYTQREYLRKAYDAGVKLCLGSDCGLGLIPCGENTVELTTLVEELGLTPGEVITCATKNCAEALGLGDELGTLEAGKVADMLVVDGDPLADIGVLRDKRRIRHTIRDGQIVCRDGQALSVMPAPGPERDEIFPLYP